MNTNRPVKTAAQLRQEQAKRNQEDSNNKKRARQNRSYAKKKKSKSSDLDVTAAPTSTTDGTSLTRGSSTEGTASSCKEHTLDTSTRKEAEVTEDTSPRGPSTEGVALPEDAVGTQGSAPRNRSTEDTAFSEDALQTAETPPTQDTSPDQGAPSTQGPSSTEHAGSTGETAPTRGSKRTGSTSNQDSVPNRRASRAVPTVPHEGTALQPTGDPIKDDIKSSAPNVHRVDDTICQIEAPRKEKLLLSFVEELVYRGDKSKDRHDLSLSEKFYRRAIQCLQEFCQRRRLVVYRERRIYDVCIKLFHVLKDNERPEDELKPALCNVLRFRPASQPPANEDHVVRTLVWRLLGGGKEDDVDALSGEDKVTVTARLEELAKEVATQNAILLDVVRRYYAVVQDEGTVPDGTQPMEPAEVGAKYVPEGVLNLFYVGCLSDENQPTGGEPCASGGSHPNNSEEAGYASEAGAGTDNPFSATPSSDESGSSSDTRRENREDLLLHDEGCLWSCLASFNANASVSCENCRRCRAYEEESSPYYFDMYWVWSRDLVSHQHCRLRKVEAAQRIQVKGSRKREMKKVCLCSECHIMLSKRIPSDQRKLWKYVWPSFYFDVLTGVDDTSGRKFSDVYPVSDLWRWFPSTLRRYWVETWEELKANCGPGSCDETSEPHFVDRTVEVMDFWANIQKRTFEGMLSALDPKRLKKGMELLEEEKNIVVPDVLCPWGCSEFTFRAGDLNAAMMMQHHLRKVQLNLPSCYTPNMFQVETSRLDYIREAGEYTDCVLMNPNWPIRPTMCMIPGRGVFVCTCRHHIDPKSRKRLYPHPPRKPPAIGNLSSVRSDQLCSVVLQPRTARPVVRKGKNTVPSVSVFQVSYAGADSANVTTERRFENNGLRPVSVEHEILSLYRQDVDELARRLVQEGQMTEELYHGLRDEYLRSDCEKTCRSLTRGATYTPCANAIALQKASSEGDMVLVTVLEKNHGRRAPASETKVYLHRSWCPTINNMQVQDNNLYGWVPKAIPHMKSLKGANRLPIMMTWCVVGIVSASKELYSIVDQKVGGHSYKDVSGYLLTWIHNKLMKHCDPVVVKKTPFSNKTSMTKLAQMLLQNVQSHNRQDRKAHRPESFYMFGHSLFQDVFREESYPRISIAKNWADLEESGRKDQTEAIILVTKEEPRGAASFTVNGKTFEARVVIGIAADSNTKKKTSAPGQFEACRFVRHGNGFRNWWQQDRNSMSNYVMRQVLSSEDSVVDNFPEMKLKPDDDKVKWFRRYIVVYVLVAPEVNVEAYKIALHESFGGQMNVMCGCNQSDSNPLIITGARPDERRTCMKPNCCKPEKYVCGMSGCETRLCTSCFKKLRETSCRDGEPCTVYPPMSEDDDSNSDYTPMDNEEDEEDDYVDEPDVDFVPCDQQGRERLDHCFETEQYEEVELLMRTDPDECDSVQGLAEEAEEWNAAHPFRHHVHRVEEGFDDDPDQLYDDEDILGRFEDEDSEDDEPTTQEQLASTSKLTERGEENGEHYGPADRLVRHLPDSECFFRSIRAHF